MVVESQSEQICLLKRYLYSCFPSCISWYLPPSHNTLPSSLWYHYTRSSNYQLLKSNKPRVDVNIILLDLFEPAEHAALQLCDVMLDPQSFSPNSPMTCSKTSRKNTPLSSASNMRKRCLPYAFLMNSGRQANFLIFTYLNHTLGLNLPSSHTNFRFDTTCHRLIPLESKCAVLTLFTRYNC